jgi:hypothetical protein
MPKPKVGSRKSAPVRREARDVPALPRLSRSHAAAASLLAALVLLVYGSLAWRWTTVEGTDYTAHAWYAEILYNTGHPPIPHFLYHLLSIAVYAAGLARSLLVAGVEVQIAFYGILAFTIYAAMRAAVRNSRLDRAPAIFLAALAGFVAQPVTMERSYAIGYFWSETYNNATLVLLKPFALISFFCASWYLSRRSRRATWMWAVFAASVVAGALTKPSYLICFLPAAAIATAILMARGAPVSPLPLLAGLGVPGLAVLGAQFYLTYAGGSGGFGYHDSIVWAPFKFMNYWSHGGLLYKLLLSIVFPVTIVIAYGRRAFLDRSLQLAWGTFVIALFYAYLLAEQAQWSAGNFTWSAYAAVFVLYIGSLVFWLRQLAADGPAAWRTPRAWLCGAAITLHAISGLRLDWSYLRMFHRLPF